ncbi:Rieske 2Fe-2S subunit signature [Acididesulfobacillus acetoxydans]|uniref:Rieske (2Fe-2S) iron-sulfur domain protein n=1 Tax=Acididesulfobacillus acetoxydans TaxID=1561005 RepID=A0A8S0WW04_9FIRM|nr:ubiquinol-cytochrome c reductase iron-sulfur subunit [Acididesulfobacillus acetoxydans]CAA7599981.1 Rieske 2Fe-2S subunit signature [Acididesulfobacillus acetoxydans]CEJ05974.1 Rieske (2Fe-2S) iron-sulfur domain protein [Acididesulfobacillus acetoxydans]
MTDEPGKRDALSDGKGLPRRRFLKTGIAGISGVLGIAYLGLIGRYLTPPAIGSDPLLPVGKTTEFSLDTPKLVVYKYGGIEQGVYVINTSDEGWIALDFHCTHLQCAVNWIPAIKKFACPCHGGVYDMKGHVLGGPPPRPLYRRIIRVQGNSVIVGGRLA